MVKGSDLNSALQAQAQEKVEHSPQAQRTLTRLALRRVGSALILVGALVLFIWWLPEASRQLLVISLIANRLLVGLLLLFGLVGTSLFWSVGQQFDVWLFKALNLRGERPPWMDGVMWIATQIGTTWFALILMAIFYVLGERHYAIDIGLGALSLSLLVTLIKGVTDRARPFNLLTEAKVIGWREAGLSFPSGHTAQTFFMMTVTINHFELPLAVAVVLFILAVLVGVTRVYLGVHYPRDVFAGAILGLVWGILKTVVAPYLTF